jgi:hypothetical protein
VSEHGGDDLIYMLLAHGMKVKGCDASRVSPGTGRSGLG